MIKWILVAFMSVLVGVGTAGAAPIGGPRRNLTPPRSIISQTVAGARAVPVEDLFESAQSDSAVWSIDGRSIIYSSTQGGRFNIWTQPLSGASAVQLTHSSSHESVQAMTPDAKWILFQADSEGRELNDIYKLPVEGGEPQNLTATEDGNETSPVVSRDGTMIAFLSRGKAESSNNVAVMDLRTGARRQLTHEAVDGLQWEVVAVSQDSQFIIANRHDWSLTLGEVYRIDALSGKATRLSADRVYAQAADLSADGRYVSLSVESSAGVPQATLLDLSTGRSRVLAPAPWEQRPGHFSPDGRTLLILSNVDGRDNVLTYDVEKARVRQLPIPEGVHINTPYIQRLPAFSPSGKQILFPHSSGWQPDDYWVYDVDQRRANRITRMGTLDTRQLPRTQIVHYTSFDGTVISALLWMPYNLKRDAKAPGIVLAHGGPTNQVLDLFNRKATALASRGYVVIAPNFRGSTGYGREFLEANRKDLGGGDLKDVVAGAQFLVATGYVNRKKIGITGGSYGGYMTLMALGKTPQVWAAGVEEFGIVNWRTMWEKGAPQNRRYQKDLVGDPQEDSALYDRMSPLTYLAQLRAPLLVLHGENDIRVPATEAHQVVDFLEQHGRVVGPRFYAGEGHGFMRRENQIDALSRCVAWFDQHLKGTE